MNKSKQSNRNNKRSAQTKRSTQLTVPWTPAVQGSNLISMDIEAYFGKLTTTVSSGVVANSYAIEAARMDNFSTRFQGFDEYRIESVLIRINCCSSAVTGLMNIWVEPNIAASATPTAGDAKANKTLTFANGANQKTHTIVYNPKNSVTQDWNDINQPNEPIGYLKAFTNNSDFGSPVTAIDVAVVTGVFRVWFRGFA